MTPEALAAIASLVERYGLPLAILAGLMWLLLTRRLVLGSEANYIEARRLEEREGRLAAEGRLKILTESLEKISDASEELTDTILETIADRNGSSGRRNDARR